MAGTYGDKQQLIVPGGVDGEELETWMGVTSGEELPEDTLYQGVRPVDFASYIGQARVKENLQIACGAAKKRGDVLDHVLLHGPPGLGKTSMARILAHELGVGFKSTSGPVLERAGDLAAILSSLDPNDVLFIDEIHRLPRVVEEVLYPAMEDFELDIIIGQGPAARSVKVTLKPFTLVGATTRSGLLTSPLRDRFGIMHRLDYYDVADMVSIVRRSAGILSIPIETSAETIIATRSRGTPRIANRLLKRVRDFAEERGDGRISAESAESALALLDVDHRGLDRMDRLFLETISDKFDGGPVGIATIAAALGEERETIEDVYEPYLLQEGFLARTKRGRTITPLGRAHLDTVRAGS